MVKTSHTPHSNRHRISSGSTRVQMRGSNQFKNKREKSSSSNLNESVTEPSEAPVPPEEQKSGTFTKSEGKKFREIELPKPEQQPQEVEETAVVKPEVVVESPVKKEKSPKPIKKPGKTTPGKRGGVGAVGDRGTVS